MYQGVNFSNFYDAFRLSERHTAWSYDGLRALYDYLIELEEDCGEPMELDVIAFDCSYSEVTPGEFCEMHGIDDCSERDELIVCQLDNDDLIVMEG